MKRKNFITLGTFDGLHIGHRYLFGRLETLAVRYLQKPLALYFPLPPKTLLSTHPEMTVLSTPAEKKHLFKTVGLDAQPLDFAQCRNQQPQDFFENVLLQKYQMGGLIVGQDFAFGKDRRGDTDFLRRACEQHAIPFEVAGFYQFAGQKVSSSLIRKTLAMGDIERVNEMLGRPYELTGTVVPGHKLGRKLGFPTANLDTGIFKILPLGVFAVKVRVGRRYYDGFCNIGFRPTVNTIHSCLPLVEVNIFDFHQSIYGRKITIWFAGKLRDETKFNGLDALVAQLKKDRTEARALLKDTPGMPPQNGIYP